ncbi:MAG TPA: WD40 repeat domain-containing protein, partial [Bacillota bacterium]|nr:WD40 repeat domain-containing protein [Bacillota bacterium]
MSDVSLLEEFLNIKYLGKYEWSPNGEFIAFIWDDGGTNDLWLVAPGVSLPQKLTSAQKGVSDLEWLPKTSEMFFVMDDAIYKMGVSPISEPSLIYRATDQITGISCSPLGTTLAFGLGGKIHLYDVASCAVKQLEMPGLLNQTSHLGIVLWSPDGTKFAFSFKDGDTYHQIA